MKTFLNSKLATSLTLVVVLCSIAGIMRLDAAHPLQWGAGAVAILGSVALSLARSLSDTGALTTSDQKDQTK